jgi:IQ calmodulin-binding motif
MKLSDSVSKTYHSGSKIFTEKGLNTLTKFFSNRMNAFYSDNSYTKYTNQKLMQKSQIEMLPDKLKELETQTKLRINAEIQLKTTLKWEEIKEKSLSYHYDQLNAFEKAATKIQKTVRGYLSRLKSDLMLLEIRQLRTDFLIQETSSLSKVCLFYLGDLPKPAAIKLQRATKRFLLRLKYSRLMKCYLYFLEENHKKASEAIKKFLLIQISKEKIRSVLFYNTREKRLTEIRENLALLTLKKFWKKRKLNFRIIRDKLLRLKRKMVALANKQAYQKLLTMAHPAKKDKNPNRSLSLSLDLEEDEEEEETDLVTEPEEGSKINQEENLEELRQKEEAKRIFMEKVTQSKAAYGIYDTKEVVVLPFLQERELNETVSNSLEIHLFEVTDAAYKKTVQAHRLSLPRVRNTAIASFSPANRKRFSSGHSILPPLLLIPANYTEKPSPKPLPRKISNARFMSIPTPCNRHHKPNKKYNQPKFFFPENNFLQKGTISASLKKSEKKSTSTSNKWNIKRRNTQYIPSLDNPSYNPSPWHPIKLNKAILETDTSTHYNISQKKVPSNPVSIASLSSRVIHKNPRQSIGQISNSPTTFGSSEFIQYDLN